MDVGSVWLAAFIQLVSALDFMMIMPLGPDLSRALDISPTYIGYLGEDMHLPPHYHLYYVPDILIDLIEKGGIALIAGRHTIHLGLHLGVEYGKLVLYPFVGRYICRSGNVDSNGDRRGCHASTTTWSSDGDSDGGFLVVSHCRCALGIGIGHVERVERTFYVVGGGLVRQRDGIYAAAEYDFPLRATPKGFSITAMLKRAVVWHAFMAIGLAIFSTFLIVPNMAAYFQFNLGVPRSDMSQYYVMGGVLSVIAMQLGGYLMDRVGAVRITLWAGD